ncbi:MAG: capsular biosynthesis protein [Clostridia bacterium]|nr:capsular biosynthesis protein [Clostridia bacterium]
MDNNQKHDTIDLLEWLRQVKRFLPLIIAVTILFGVGGFLFSRYLITPEYESSIMMIVNTKQDNITTVTNDNIQSAKNLVSTYSIIIKSNTVLNQVIENLGLNEEYDTLRHKVYVSAVDDTQVMRIAVRDEDSANATQIINEIASIAPDVIVDAVEAGSCKVISQVVTSDGQVTPNVMKNTVIATAIGFLVVMTAVILINAFRVKKIVTEDDLKKLTGLPILGVIPEVKEGK